VLHRKNCLFSSATTWIDSNRFSHHQAKCHVTVNGRLMCSNQAPVTPVRYFACNTCTTIESVSVHCSGRGRHQEWKAFSIKQFSENLSGTTSSQHWSGSLWRSSGQRTVVWRGDIVRELAPRVGLGYPLPPLLLPCPFTSSSFALYYFFLFSFSHSLYLFLSIVHPIPFYQNRPTPFPGERS